MCSSVSCQGYHCDYLFVTGPACECAHVQAIHAWVHVCSCVFSANLAFFAQNERHHVCLHAFICRLARGCLLGPMQERVEIHTFQQPLLCHTTGSQKHQPLYLNIFQQGDDTPIHRAVSQAFRLSQVILLNEISSNLFWLYRKPCIQWNQRKMCANISPKVSE